MPIIYGERGVEGESVTGEIVNREIPQIAVVIRSKCDRFPMRFNDFKSACSHIVRRLAPPHTARPQSQLRSRRNGWQGCVWILKHGSGTKKKNCANVLWRRMESRILGAIKRMMHVRQDIDNISQMLLPDDEFFRRSAGCKWISAKSFNRKNPVFGGQ